MAAGIDPSRERQAARQAAGLARTFAEVAGEWLDRQRGVLVARTFAKKQWMLETLVGPWLGHRPIAEIEPPELLAALRRIESRGLHETAHRTKQQCGQVFRYAIATGRANRDADSAQARIAEALDDLGVSAAERPDVERASRRAARRSRRELTVTLRIPRFEAVRAAMTGLSGKRGAIEASRDLSLDEKRSQLDAVMVEQVRLARSALGRKRTTGLEALGLEVKGH